MSGAESERLTRLREVDDAWDIDVERELGRFITQRPLPPNDPAPPRSRVAAALLSIAIAALLVSGLIWVRRGAGVHEAATSGTTHFTTGQSSVPEPLQAVAVGRANADACTQGQGRFTVVGLAQTDLASWMVYDRHEAEVAANGSVLVPPSPVTTNGATTPSSNWSPEPLFSSAAAPVYAVLVGGTCPGGAPVGARIIFNGQGVFVRLDAWRLPGGPTLADPFGPKSGSTPDMWSVPITGGVVEPEAQASSGLSFAPVPPSLPPEVGSLVHVVGGPSFPAARRPIAWVFEGPSGPFFIEEAPSGTTTTAMLQAVATCSDEVSSACPAAGKSMISLQSGTRALLMDGSQNGGFATSVAWVKNGIEFKVVGPTNTLRPDEAVGIANHVAAVAAAAGVHP